MLFWQRKTILFYFNILLHRPIFWLVYAAILLVSSAAWYCFVYQPLVREFKKLDGRQTHLVAAAQGSVDSVIINPVEYGLLLNLIEQQSCELKEQVIKVRASVSCYSWLEYSLHIEGSFASVAALCSTLSQYSAYKMQKMSMHSLGDGLLKVVLLLQAYEERV